MRNDVGQLASDIRSSLFQPRKFKTGKPVRAFVAFDLRMAFEPFPNTAASIR